MVWLAAVTGMRWEEAAALRVGDFDLDEGTVTIDETVIRGTDGRPQFSRTKTAAAVRTIPLPADVVKMVEKRIADLGELGERTPERLLWSAPDDPAAPLAANWFRHKIWCEALREVGLYDAKPHRPGFHDLRRAYSTALIVGGVDVKTAQDLMGHADIATTLNIYAKATTESRRNASDVSAARFFPEG
jgi:integrase